MPPPATIDPAWVQGGHFDSLVAALAQLAGPAPGAGAAQYQQLAPCLPFD